MDVAQVLKGTLAVVWLLTRLLLSYVEALWDLLKPKQPARIHGKVVVLTGGSRGIGKEIALLLIAQGARVAVWDVLEKENLATCEELRKKGGDVKAYTVDVTSVESVHQAAEQTRKDFGDPDILINNAGILICRDILGLSERDIRRTFEVNSIAHFWTVKEFLPAMLKRKRGHIVTIASMAAKAGTPLLTDYCASKFAAYGFTEALEAEVHREHNCTDIKFTTVCPMFVNTNLINDLTDRINFRVARGDHMLQPRDVAQQVVESGILYKKRYVYIPRQNALTDTLIGILPRKGMLILGNFLDTGFFAK
jgi:all-trans-retinol dehydrogenase (NAD+)